MKSIEINKPFWVTSDHHTEPLQLTLIEENGKIVLKVEKYDEDENGKPIRKIEWQDPKTRECLRVSTEPWNS
ncbi:hypothetical protein [uncultured Akkermansia sp.]|uniref:hypothetical protein n=1 Tax=uncultured Akkermansia sp. TaxID=512294 RepID=UPI002623E1EA|nr:hypothetical protein [uncultured Akkermansia sp.]